MKTLKLGMMLMVLIMGFSACKKEVGTKGETGATGQSGPDAIMRSYTINFSAGDTYKSYSGFVGKFDAGDIIITYVDDPNESNLAGFWVQTPYINSNSVNFYAEITDDGTIYNNTVVAGEGTSPWTSLHYFNYRSVLIKGSGLIKNPNVDYSNYQEVKEAFDL